MNNWNKQEFEITRQPNEGDPVQYAVLYILQLKKLGIENEDVKFYMREIEDENL